MSNNEILVLGVGNILCSDEGAGVHCVHRLQQRYAFSENVKLLDGGTLGMRLLGALQESTYCIVADVATFGFAPGYVMRLGMEDIPKSCPAKNSLHQVNFSETLVIAQSLGILPVTVIIGIEPLDIETSSISLTPPVAEKIDEMCGRILDEIIAAGGSYEPKPEAGREEDIFKTTGSVKPSFDYDTTGQYNNLYFFGHGPH
jgi:hydrogenase maturation protease